MPSLSGSSPRRCTPRAAQHLVFLPDTPHRFPHVEAQVDGVSIRNTMPDLRWEFPRWLSPRQRRRETRTSSQAHSRCLFREGGSLEKFTDGRIVKCFLCEEPAIASAT
jgi:hypothetical protein